MDHSKVYVRIHFLLHLKDASVSERKTTLTNITPGQLEALGEVATRVSNGVLSLMRRDVQAFNRYRTVLRMLGSQNVSFNRKKSLIRRHHLLIPRLLRTWYLIQVIQDEIRTAREA